MKRMPLLLTLSLGFGLLTACGDRDVDVEIDESTVTDPAYFFNRGVQSLKVPDSRTGEIDYQAAYDDLVKAANLDPNNPAVQFNAGWAAERLGKRDKAESHYRKALEIDATYENALWNLANLLTAAERHDEAVEIYDGYLAGKPDDYETWNSKVSALTAAGRYDEAVAEGQAILQANPDNVAAYRNLSRVYFAQGEYGMSQLCAEKAKTLQDGDPGIYNNMGVTYLQQGDQAAAIESFKTAIKIDPDNLEANLNLGWVALDSGDYTLALTCFTAATGNSPENVDALLGLAVAQRGTMDYEGAGKTYDRIIELDPNNQVVYFNAATLHEKYTKDFKKAKKVLQAYVDVMEGQLSPTHEVFARIDGIKAAEDAETARLAELKRLEDERLAREARQKEQLVALATRTDQYNKKLEAASCPAVAEMGMLEEFAMIGEQATMVVEAEDFQMAGDMITFLDSMEPMLDDMASMCGGGDAPAPEEAPAEEAPAEEAPAEEAPAEEVPAEEPPAEDAPTEGPEKR